VSDADALAKPGEADGVVSADAGVTDAAALVAANTAAVVAAEPPLPKPATWTVRAPIDAWCPTEVEQALGAVLTVEQRARLLARRDAVAAHPTAAVDERSHSHAEHVRTAQWQAVAAARRGRRHAHVGAWCEDASFCALTEQRGVLVVADGAGSAAWSRLGSAIAVDAVGLALRDASALTEDAVLLAIERAVTLLRSCAEAMKVAPRLLRTTLLAVAWERAADGEIRVVTSQVGDGMLVLAHADGRITQPSIGDAGEWSGEVHCFLPDDETMSRARAATRSYTVSDLAAVLLVTDGVEDALYPFPRHAPSLLSQLVHGVQHPLTGLTAQALMPSVLNASDPGSALLDWLGFEKRGENDDRTLAVALHHSASHSIAPWAPSTSA
jgi:hypothetical protein